MNKIIIATVTALFAGSLYASDVDFGKGNPDVQGTILHQHEGMMSTAMEPGVGDVYGNIFWNPVDSTDIERGGLEKGQNDTYGSILYDVTDYRF